MINMIKSETKIVSCVAGGDGLEDMTAEVNDYIKDKGNIEISYHNITANDHGYVIATVKVTGEKPKGGRGKKA